MVCVCGGGAFWVIIGVFFFPLSVPKRVFSPFDLGSDSVDDITTKTVPVHSVVGSFCPTFSLKMTSRPVPALSQYLYDEEDEVRKKKPRRKLPSNAAITRVRRAHLSPPPLSLPLVCFAEQFAAALPSDCHLILPRSSSAAPSSLVPLLLIVSVNPSSPSYFRCM